MTITESPDTATAPIAADEQHDPSAELADASAANAPAAEPEASPAAQPDAAPATGDADLSAVAEPDAPTADADGTAPGEAPAADSPKPARSRSPRRSAASGSAAPGSARDRRTTAQRLGNFPRADRPAAIPAPEHHHLPGWVRRDFARARPPLSNILALLEGEPHDQFLQRITELNEGISSGKFSLAWQYPDLVDEGRALYEKQRREQAEGARANRQLDSARRRVQDRIRDAGDAMAADVAARLQRQLRTATTVEEINAVTVELDGAVSVAKTSAEKRREREIERTRARIQRSAASAGVAATEEPRTETWQDVLRRFAEEQAAGSRASE